MLALLGIRKELDSEIRTDDAAYDLIQQRVRAYRAQEIEQLMLQNGLSRNIVHSPESWLKTEMGKSLALHPLVNYSRQSACSHLAPTELTTLGDRDTCQLIQAQG